MLRTTGLAHDALAVLEEQGWDAFVALQAAKRRARRRLPWRRSQSLPKLEPLEGKQQQQQQDEAAAAEDGLAEAAADGREEEEALQPTEEQHAALRRLLAPAASLLSAVGALSAGRRPRPLVERAVSMRGPVAQQPQDDFPLPQEGAAAAGGTAAQGAVGR